MKTLLLVLILLVSGCSTNRSLSNMTCRERGVTSSECYQARQIEDKKASEKQTGTATGVVLGCVLTGPFCLLGIGPVVGGFIGHAVSGNETAPIIVSQLDKSVVNFDPPAPLSNQAPMAENANPARPMISAQKPSTKIVATLVQYDGPKIKSGVTLDAHFNDDGTGNGEAIVTDVRNQTLRGTFVTIKPGDTDWPKPKVVDRATLNKLQIRNDQPWYISTVSNGDTVLECVYGSTLPLSQTKGDCRDNYGNRYHLAIAP